MSFIITTASLKTVVQVSDTRHSSLANQRPLDDELRKTLIVQGMRARFVHGWLGEHRRPAPHKTADWIFKTLFEMNAVELSIEDIADRLQFLATTHFAKLTALDKRILFVMAGWEKSEPFVCIVSNYVSPKSAEDSTHTTVR